MGRETKVAIRQNSTPKKAISATTDGNATKCNTPKRAFLRAGEVRHMRATNWNQRTDSVTAAKRAGGRRKYNALRQFKAEFRRMKLSALLGNTDRGCQSQFAKELGVSRSTICRDLARLKAAWLQHLDTKVRAVPPWEIREFNKQKRREQKSDG